jgi:spoIIIJ-associated protein
LVLNIKTEFSNYLIGQHGINLQALQHIARILARKKIEDRVNFILDVNSYRQDKNNSIANLAKSMAEQAISEKRAVVLRPMSPYERRLVHLELSQNDQVKTESIGEGEDRRIVIKPINLV